MTEWLSLPFPCDARRTPSGVPVLLWLLSFGLLCWLFSLLLVSQFKASKGLYSFLFPSSVISSTSQVSNHSTIMQMTPFLAQTLLKFQIYVSSFCCGLPATPACRCRHNKWQILHLLRKASHSCGSSDPHRMPLLNLSIVHSVTQTWNFGF